ncbi:SpoIIAA family protein [Labilibacter marinus]|uniref:STAS/SEC14 domain-containing protein n=1 Tax=Labilibacter marinus TaxID=1477105 RepID=UPI00082C7923|nr:STAS/SEC14 domain-containing protein [Labilibacter marinus]
MSERVSLIEHKGAKVAYLNFSGLKTIEEAEKAIQESKNYIRIQPENSVLTLSNMENMHFNSDIKNEFSTFIGGNKPYVKAGAVIGLSGLLRIIYNGVNKITGRNIKSFDTKEDALDWLSMQ